MLKGALRQGESIGVRGDRGGACRSPLEPRNRLHRATPLEQVVSHAPCRCTGSGQRIGRDAMELRAPMGGKRVDQCLTKQTMREPISVRGLDDEASREPSIECIERRQLLQLADRLELICGEFLAHDRGPLESGTQPWVQAVQARLQDVVESLGHHDRAVRLDRRGELLDEEGVALGLAPDRIDGAHRRHGAMHLLHDRAGGVSREWPEGDLVRDAFAKEARAHLRQCGRDAHVPVGGHHEEWLEARSSNQVVGKLDRCVVGRVQILEQHDRATLASGRRQQLRDR